MFLIIIIKEKQANNKKMEQNGRSLGTQGVEPASLPLQTKTPTITLAAHSKFKIQTQPYQPTKLTEIQNISRLHLLSSTTLDSLTFRKHF